MISNEELIEINKQRAFYYFKEGTKVHISLSTGKWVNGIIKEFFSEGFILDETVEGEQPIFYIEIIANGISKYTNDKKDLNIQENNK